MKLKYYLRGLGLGVLLTSIIMGVALSGKNKSMSDEEVIRRAKQLGMVEAENTLSEYSGAQKNAEEEDDGTTSNQAVLEDGKEETLPVSLSDVEAIGIPSTTYRGVLFPSKERAPRMVICEEAPGIPDEAVMFKPETLPEIAPAKSVLIPCINLSDFTSCTA